MSFAFTSCFTSFLPLLLYYLTCSLPLFWSHYCKHFSQNILLVVNTFPSSVFTLLSLDKKVSLLGMEFFPYRELITESCNLYSLEVSEEGSLWYILIHTAFYTEKKMLNTQVSLINNCVTKKIKNVPEKLQVVKLLIFSTYTKIQKWDQRNTDQIA